MLLDAESMKVFDCGQDHFLTLTGQGHVLTLNRSRSCLDLDPNRSRSCLDLDPTSLKYQKSQFQRPPFKPPERGNVKKNPKVKRMVIIPHVVSGEGTSVVVAVVAFFQAPSFRSPSWHHSSQQ